MDAELKAKWVAALRSGEYKQGQHVLRNSLDHFCCLGVLADIHSPDKWSLDKSTDNYKHDGYWEAFPRTLEDAGIIASSAMNYLSEMNDSGRTFAEIADYIEANL